MNHQKTIADAHAAASRHLDRLIILALLLPAGRENLPKSQQDEIDAWMFEMADCAKGCLNLVVDTLANLQGDGK